MYDTERLKESSCGTFTKISTNLAVVSVKIPKSQEWAEFWSPLPISASLVIVYRLVWPGTPGTLFWSALGASNEPLPWYYVNFRFGILGCSFNLEHCIVLEFLLKKLTDGIQIFWMFLKDRDLIQTMLLEWIKSIDTCCEVALRKISTVRYPLLTYSLKYPPSFIVIS